MVMLTFSIFKISECVTKERVQKEKTFLLSIIFPVSDFNYQLSKLHEQHATDMALLVENFRRKTNDVQANS